MLKKLRKHQQNPDPMYLIFYICFFSKWLPETHIISFGLKDSVTSSLLYDQTKPLKCPLSCCCPTILLFCYRKKLFVRALNCVAPLYCMTLHSSKLERFPTLQLLEPDESRNLRNIMLHYYKSFGAGNYQFPCLLYFNFFQQNNNILSI